MSLWSISRRYCRHISIARPLQKQRMTPSPRGLYLRWFPFVEKCFSVFWMESTWGRCKLLEYWIIIFLLNSHQLLSPCMIQTKKGPVSTCFYSSAVVSNISINCQNACCMFQNSPASLNGIQLQLGGHCQVVKFLANPSAQGILHLPGKRAGMSWPQWESFLLSLL